MARWSIGSYNRFISEAMSKHDISRRDAAELYRELRKSLDHPVFRTDLKRHPVYVNRALGKIEREREREKSLDDLLTGWDDIPDDDFDYDVEYDGTFEY